MADPVDEALIAALSTEWGHGTDADGTAEGLTSEDLAARSGLPVAVVEAVAREGLLHPVPGVTPGRYAADDVSVLRAGTTLLEAGLPLGELLDLARRADQSLRELADHAVEVFLAFVRDPLRARDDDPEATGEALVASFRRMLPATSDLVGAHFRRLLLTAARARVEPPPSDTAP